MVEGDIDSHTGGNCYTMFHENSSVSFTNNNAIYGGGIFSDITSKVSFDENTIVSFY